MKKVLLSLITSAFIALAGISANAEEMRDTKFNWNSPMSPVEQAIKDATTENKKAKKAKFEWRDTGKMIKKAKKLAKAGKIAEAIKLAKKARKQAINAQHQALVAKDAGPHLF